MKAKQARVVVKPDYLGAKTFLRERKQRVKARVRLLKFLVDNDGN
jgi:hypothetical protein